MFGFITKKKALHIAELASQLSVQHVDGGFKWRRMFDEAEVMLKSATHRLKVETETNIQLTKMNGELNYALHYLLKYVSADELHEAIEAATDKEALRESVRVVPG